MNKSGVQVGVLLCLMLSIALVYAAAENTSNTSTTTSEPVPQAQAATTTSSSSDSVGSLGNLSDAFICLEERVGNDCAKATTVTELALTILATPTNVMDACVAKLEAKRQTDNSFGSIKDTALAILALNHAGKSTTQSENWLKSREMTPTDIIWFLQQDSDGAVNCKFDDGKATYDIVIDENKKIGADAGNCLRRAQSNFWYQIDPACYATLFKISCDKDFITNLLYKNRLSSTIFVLEDTKQSPAFGTTEERINAKCLGVGSCDYEGTLWGSFALQVTGNDVDEYVPYIIASADTKKHYLPSAFIYLLTGYENYATKLVQDQQFGSYWEAESSAYNRYYDTSLALLSLGTNQEQTLRARDWLLFEQGANGCWGNSIRETAFVLWVLLQRDYRVEPTTVFCEEAGFYCVDRAFCSTENDLGDETYYCSGTTRTCCREREARTCFELSGTICADNEACLGFATQASDTSACCLAGCGELTPQTTQCEENYYNCYDSCAEGYVNTGHACSANQVCCRPDTAQETGGGLPWWFWVLIILILILLVFLIYRFRDKIRGMFNKKKDADAENAQGFVNRPGMPPTRPGMPPMRHGMPPRRGPPLRRPMPRRPGSPLPPQQRQSVAAAP